MTHLVSRFSAVAVALALAAGAALAGFWGDNVPGTEASHAGGMAAMSIDTNIAGNDADTLGTNNNCVSVAPGGSITVDVTALAIPVTNPMIAWTYTMIYDPGVFTVSAADADFLITVSPGSQFLTFSEPPPDTDGEYTGNAADTNTNAAEFGSGVLERLTLDIAGSAAAGEHLLTLSVGGHIDTTSAGYQPDSVVNATVMVGQPCPTGAGDVDCSATVAATDALKILRHSAGLTVNQNEPPLCPDIGTDAGGGRLQGDVDCAGSVTPTDALKVLRAVAGLTVQQEPGCPSIS